MSKRAGGRKVASVAGLGAMLVLAVGAVCWQDFAVHYHRYRLGREPEHLLAIVGRPEGTAERKAVRRHFRSRPRPMPEPGREGRPTGELDAADLPPELRIGVEADTWKDLLTIAKPTLASNEGDLVWIHEDAMGQPVFTLDRAYRVKAQGNKTQWVLFDNEERLHPHMEVREFAKCVVTLSDEKPDHDHGPGDYAVVLAEDPGTGVLYEIGWQQDWQGTAHSFEGRRLYLLKDRQRGWRFIGEGPAETGSSWHSISHAVDVRCEVEWTHRTEAPVRLRFLEVRSYWNGEGAQVIERTTYRDGVLEGETPARLQEIAWEYLIAEEGDTVDRIASRLARGTDDEELSELTWRICLLEMNPDLPEGPMPAGTRLWVPSETGQREWGERLRRSKKGRGSRTA
ncbi:MAG: hypothetical protein HY721_08360, partial [Planctomycetes bacterium]|nr:hypothetical protein [Planctomycetota bacterium]